MTVDTQGQDLNSGSSVLDRLRDYHDRDKFRELHWEGSFEEYVEIIRQDPGVLRNAYQRLYDLVMEPGFEEYEDNKKKKAKMRTKRKKTKIILSEKQTNRQNKQSTLTHIQLTVPAQWSPCTIVVIEHF